MLMFTSLERSHVCTSRDYESIWHDVHKLYSAHYTGVTVAFIIDTVDLWALLCVFIKYF